MRFEGQVW